MADGTLTPGVGADEAATGRWPDFIILGAMKSGTTTLFDWLGQGDDVCLPRSKEPGHLAAASFGAAEQQEYRSLFATPLLTGEASVRYGWPWEAEVVARRLGDLPRLPRIGGAADRVPAPARALGRRLLQREANPVVDGLLATADDPLPPDTAAVVRAERERLDDEWGLRW